MVFSALPEPSAPPCRFMEFEAEEEMQIQNTQLMSGPQSLPPAAPLKLDPPGPPVPEVCPQPGKATQCQQEPVGQELRGSHTETSHFHPGSGM